MFQNNPVSERAPVKITKSAFTQLTFSDSQDRNERKSNQEQSCESQLQQSGLPLKNYVDEQNQNLSGQCQGHVREIQLQKCLTSAHSNQNKNKKRTPQKFVDQDENNERQSIAADGNTSIVKGSWAKEEDQLLIQLVTENGAKNWSSIAKKLKGRMGKQCRERWHNHLNPDIKKQKWTQQQDRKIIDLHQKFGNKWALISRYLPGRTDNAIKNHWNSTISRKLAQQKFIKDLEGDNDNLALTPRKNKFDSDWNTANTYQVAQTPDRSGQKYSAYLGSISVNLFSKKKNEVDGSKQENQKNEMPKIGLVLPLFNEIKANSSFFMQQINKILQIESLLL